MKTVYSLLQQATQKDHELDRQALLEKAAGILQSSDPSFNSKKYLPVMEAHFNNPEDRKAYSLLFQATSHKISLL